MTISINHQTRVVYVPQADLDPLSPDLYLLDVDDFRMWLNDWADGDGICMPDTHEHYPEVVVGGVTLARVVRIINGYTITFEDGQYGVQLAGANNNIADVTNVNSVSIRSNNSAGLTAAADPADIADAVHNYVVENSINVQETLRLMMAVLLGKVSGVGTGTESFRDTGDSKDRIVATIDAEFNRTSVVLDPS